VAFLARNDGVFSEKRKMREIVIVGDLLPPSRFVVALLAIGAELALMRVVLLVAGYAGSPGLVTVKIAGVAGFAAHARMGVVQREFRLRMIEANGFPLRSLMA
jgi:hypothetical protein